MIRFSVLLLLLFSPFSVWAYGSTQPAGYDNFFVTSNEPIYVMTRMEYRLKHRITGNCPISFQSVKWEPEFIPAEVIKQIPINDYYATDGALSEAGSHTASCEYRMTRLQLYFHPHQSAIKSEEMTDFIEVDLENTAEVTDVDVPVLYSGRGVLSRVLDTQLVDEEDELIPLDKNMATLIRLSVDKGRCKVIGGLCHP
tara:strand:+ start:92125 stop:92718 length:594 start_codon:yes stop_codon:yes gene_type:complete